MSRKRVIFGLALLMGLLSVAVTQASAGKHHAVRKHPAKAEPATPEVPAGPPAPLIPLTLAQMPATPPQVTYNGVDLTISAQNATLGDILQAVHVQTKASIDLPGNPADRVVGQFGPGPVREVLAELLNGSRFNYIMLGSVADPSGVQKLILTPKPPPLPQTAQNQAAPPEANPYPRVAGFNDSVDQGDDNSDADDVPAPPPIGQPDAQPTPDGQPQIRTPEQLLQELQRQQQLMQQQQQQQGAPQDIPAQPPRQR